MLRISKMDHQSEQSEYFNTDFAIVSYKKMWAHFSVVHQRGPSIAGSGGNHDPFSEKNSHASIFHKLNSLNTWELRKKGKSCIKSLILVGFAIMLKEIWAIELYFGQTFCNVNVDRNWCACAREETRHEAPHLCLVWVYVDPTLDVGGFVYLYMWVPHLMWVHSFICICVCGSSTTII